jgi:phosphoglycolate phosphatase-like HAD superfamily hydrolase
MRSIEPGSPGAAAARAAEMFALGARYGYFGAADAPERWPADAWIDSPLELLDWVEP